jgi:hypothetical protein
MVKGFAQRMMDAEVYQRCGAAQQAARFVRLRLRLKPASSSPGRVTAAFWPVSNSWALRECSDK